MAATYYVNLTLTTSGDGSESSPFNYAQLVNYFDSSYGTAHGVVVDYDTTFMLSGNLNGFYHFNTNYPLFFNYALPSAGTFKFIGVGPVVIFSNKCVSGNCITVKTGSETAFNNSTLEFHNIALILSIDVAGFPCGISGGWYNGGVYSGPNVIKNMTFKNCYINNPIGYLKIKQFVGDLNLYGCTLDGNCYLGDSNGVVGDITVYDSHLYGHISIKNSIILTAEGNSRINAISLTSNSNITKYIEPVLVTEDKTLPVLDSYLGAVDFFSKKENILYTNYNLRNNGLVYRGVSPTLRVTNDFVYDVYGNPRDGSGMFAFGDSDEVIGLGSVGAFYFGGDYTNSNITVWNPAVIRVMAMDMVKDVTASYLVPEVTLSPYNTKKFVPSLTNRFELNFSATPITKGQMGSIIEDGVINGKSVIIHSVTGTSPFTVQFTPFGYADNMPSTSPDFVWKVTSFNWDFGDGNIESSTEPIIRHTFCGPHGNKYQVQVSLDYELVEIQ